MEHTAPADEAAFIADELARLQQAHKAFLDRLPRSAESALDELSGTEISGGIVVHALGHRIETTHRPVFKDERPWFMEYVFSVVNPAPPIPLLTLALIGGKLYDLANPGEVLVKVNSLELCERLVGALVKRLAVFPLVAPRV